MSLAPVARSGVSKVAAEPPSLPVDARAAGDPSTGGTQVPRLAGREGRTTVTPEDTCGANGKTVNMERRNSIEVQ
jgi:hypothetical protein